MLVGRRLSVMVLVEARSRERALASVRHRGCGQLQRGRHRHVAVRPLSARKKTDTSYKYETAARHPSRAKTRELWPDEKHAGRSEQVFLIRHCCFLMRRRPP